MRGRRSKAETRVLIHLIAQAILTVLMTVVSYLAPPWSAAYAETYVSIRNRLGPTGISPALLNLAVPTFVLLMVVNQALAISAIARSSLASSRRYLIWGSMLLALIGVLSFPGASHDLELYHAHARMAIHGINPYLVTPLEAFGEGLPATMPWQDQLAPYGPLAIGLHAVLIGSMTDPWVAALALKGLYALVSVVFVWTIVRVPGIRDPWKAAAAIVVGWSPLLILEFAGNGHADSLMGSLCALAFLSFLQGRSLLPWFLLGLASIVKIEAMIFFPILVAAGARVNKGALRRIALPTITVAVLLAGYIAFGGPQNAVAGLRAEASKVLRSVPQLAGYFSGVPTGQVLWALRVIFVAAFAGITYGVARGRSILAAAPLLYAIYLCLGKSFLQPWHGALLIYLLAASHLWGERARPLSLATATWSVSAVLGGYSYLIATRNLGSTYQATSTMIMVVPVLLVVIGSALGRFTLHGESHTAGPPRPHGS